MVTAKQPDLDEACRVHPVHLAHLGVLHETLSALNDACVSASVIARCIEKLPPLRARLERRFRKQTGAGRTVPQVSEQLAHLGNREFEAVLLELLEDLTMLRADVDEAKVAAAARRMSMGPRNG